MPFFNEVFRQLGCTYVSSYTSPSCKARSLSRSFFSRVEWLIEEGSSISPITQCAIARGPVRKLLLGERVALNTLARCSGIATRYVINPSVNALPLRVLRQRTPPTSWLRKPKILLPQGSLGYAIKGHLLTVPSKIRLHACPPPHFGLHRCPCWHP